MFRRCALLGALLTGACASAPASAPVPGPGERVYATVEAAADGAADYLLARETRVESAALIFSHPTGFYFVYAGAGERHKVGIPVADDALATVHTHVVRNQNTYCSDRDLKGFRAIREQFPRLRHFVRYRWGSTRECSLD